MKSKRNGQNQIGSRVESLRQELKRKIASLTASSEKIMTEIPGLLLVRRTAPTEPCTSTYEPGLIVVAQGAKRVDLGQISFVYDRSKYLLTAIDLPIVSQIVEASEDEPMLALGLKLDMPVVRELLSREEVHVRNTPSESPGMVTGEVTAELLGACIRLLELLATPQDAPYMSGLIQREIIYRLLSGPEGARLRSIATLGDQSHRTAKAIAWIKDNYMRAFRVDDLAVIAGMGVSTFHHHFRVLTNMSPLQYQKNLRLQAARGRMLVDGMDATTVAFAVGYGSINQFNREYSRYFGQSPMRDVRALLASPPAEVRLLSR